MKNINRNISTSKQEPARSENPIVEYLKRRHETLQDALQMTERYFAVEGIHDLRVEIKKIRALFRFIEQLKPSFESGPLLDKMRQLFRTAGKMRDIDIQQGIIQKEITRLDVSELINYLKHQELKGRPKLEKLCDDFDNHILMGNLKRMRAAMGNVSAAELQAPMRSILEKHAHDLIKVANKTRPTNDDFIP